MEFNLFFPDRSKTLPRTRVDVGLHDYIHRMIFAIGGRPISRIELIKLLADQKGAHTDEKSDVLHKQSKGGSIATWKSSARQTVF